MWRTKLVKVSGAVCLVAVLYWWFTRPPVAFITTPNPEYEYIVVGAGTAGCVLASRLSQHHSVLLIEAGNEFSFLSPMPLAAPFLQMSSHDWQHRTVSQHNSSFGLVDRVSFWPRGKGLGGTAQLNYLVHYPGKPADFAAWEALGGGWTYQNMLQYTNKLKGKKYRREEFTVEQDTWSRGRCDHRHVFLHPDTCDKGSVRFKVTSRLSRAVFRDDPSIRVVTEDRYQNPLLNAFLESARELKHLKVAVKAGESTIHKGQRWNALNSHLQPAIRRHVGLHILASTHCNKVLIEGGTAVGVEYAFAGGVEAVRATKEVVVSAGAVKSPQLLMLSGIGPKRVLKKFGIKVAADLPVGSNLHDHLNVPVYVSLEAEVSVTLSKVLKLSQALKYLVFKKGLFSSSAVAGTASEPGGAGLILFGMGSTEEKLLRVIANYRQDVFESVFPHHLNHSQEGFVFLVTCLTPLSRGRVTIPNSVPTSSPLIDPDYLGRREDVECTRRGIKLAKRLTMTQSFKSLGAKLHLPSQLTDCSEFSPDINDNEYLECLIRTVGFTGYHPGGSVSVRAVLDPKLRVKGIRRLRVVDGSVLPAPLGGTPNSLIMAIAERTAHLILNQPSELPDD